MVNVKIRKFYIWDGKSTICLFWKANGSFVNLMISSTAGFICDTDLNINIC